MAGGPGDAVEVILSWECTGGWLGTLRRAAGGMGTLVEGSGKVPADTGRGTEADTLSLWGVPLGTLAWLTGVGQRSLLRSRGYGRVRWGVCSHCDQIPADTSPSCQPLRSPAKVEIGRGSHLPQGGRVTAPAQGGGKAEDWWGWAPPAEALTPRTAGLLSSARCRLKGVYRGGLA